MTYRELLESLNKLTSEQLDMDVTVFCCDEIFSHGDEFFPVDGLLTASVECGILDENHPYLIYYK